LEHGARLRRPLGLGLRQGFSIRAIAKRLHVSRNTVRAALRRGGPPIRAPQHRPPSKLEPFKDYLVGRLTEFPELSAAALFDEISAMGYAAGLSILKDLTRPYRVRRREPVVRFETPPGKQAQVDWAHLGVHSLDGKPTHLYLFVMVLSFSRALYAEVTTSMKTDVFLALHVKAFETFGGIPAEILYDNAKTVVLSRTKDGPVFHPALLDFCGRFGFSPKACRPYRAKTKGKVERSIGYVKDRFLVGRTFTGISDMNHQLAAWIEKANRREHGTTGERPCDRLCREKLAQLSSAGPWSPSPPARAHRSSFRFETFPVVEVRPLTVYEEACG
jgi:transposase